jgi:hypothetical protein
MTVGETAIKKEKTKKKSGRSHMRTLGIELSVISVLWFNLSQIFATSWD